MDAQIIQRLNDINRQFYATIAHDFDETRGKAWAGWEILMSHIPKPSHPYHILDVGCGNGRFGVFVAHQWGRNRVIYYGIDNNADLLDIARHALSASNITHNLWLHDIVADSIPFEPIYDLVVAFGVVHHIPSLANRIATLKRWSDAVKPGGYLAFACWRFYEFDRFRQRIHPWDADLADQVEAGDHLLDWRRGATALRYCHYVDDDEHEMLIRATHLQTIADYRADGFTNTVNRYTLLQKPL